MGLGDEKYVASTTFRKSGVAVTTVTWIVALDGDRVGFWTSSGSGKYKRLRNNPRLTLQASNSRGRVKAGSAAVEGTAVLATSGPDYDEVKRRVKAKYGPMVALTRFLYTLSRVGKRRDAPYGNAVVVVTLAAETPSA